MGAKEETTKLFVSRCEELYRQLLVTWIGKDVLYEEQAQDLTKAFRGIMEEATESFLSLSPPESFESEDQKQKEIQTFSKYLLKKSGAMINQQVPLNQLIPDSNVNFHDPENFNQWIKEEYQYRKGNPSIQAQVHLNELENCEPNYKILKARKYELLDQLKNNTQFKEIMALRTKIEKAENSITKIESALCHVSEEKKDSLLAKLDSIGLFISETKTEYERCTKEFSLYLEFENVTAQLDVLSHSNGVQDAKNTLRKVNYEAGKASGTSGSSFESMSRNAVLQLVVENHCSELEVAALLGDATAMKKSPVALLHSVTLGMAAAEIDYVLVRGRKGTEEEITSLKNKQRLMINKQGKKLGKGISFCSTYIVTEVLAVIECKANARDILHNVPRMQTMMSWLTHQNEVEEGHSEDAYYYDSDVWRTSHFPNGFVKPSSHACIVTQDLWLFPPTSFGALGRDSDGFFRKGLYYITKQGTIQIPAGKSMLVISKCIKEGIDFDNISEHLSALEDVRQYCLNEFEDFSRSFRVIRKLARPTEDQNELKVLQILPFHFYKE